MLKHLTCEIFSPERECLNNTKTMSFAQWLHDLPSTEGCLCGIALSGLGLCFRHNPSGHGVPLRVCTENNSQGLGNGVQIAGVASRAEQRGSLQAALQGKVQC